MTPPVTPPLSQVEITRQDWNAWDLHIADLNSALAPEDDQNAESVGTGKNTVTPEVGEMDILELFFYVSMWMDDLCIADWKGLSHEHT